MSIVRRLKIWADGSCAPNPGRGSWAYVTSDSRSGSGVEEDSTNSRAELLAAINAVEQCGKDPLLIISDSQYVIFGANDRLDGLIRNGFKTRSGKNVPNIDLWQRLAGALEVAREVQFQWIPKNSEPGNVEADRLANEARRSRA